MVQVVQHTSGARPVLPTGALSGASGPPTNPILNTEPPPPRSHALTLFALFFRHCLTVFLLSAQDGTTVWLACIPCCSARCKRHQCPRRYIASGTTAAATSLHRPRWRVSAECADGKSDTARGRGDRGSHEHHFLHKRFSGCAPVRSCAFTGDPLASTATTRATR